MLAGVPRSLETSNRVRIAASGVIDRPTSGLPSSRVREDWVGEGAMSPPATPAFGARMPLGCSESA